MRVGVGVGGVGGEKHRCHDRLQLDIDARLLARLLDDGLRLLPGRVDRGLEHELQRLAVLGANAVGALLPAGGLENLVGLLDVEFEFGIFRPDAFRAVQEVCGGATGAAVDEFLDRGAIDQQVEGLAHRRSLNSGCLVFRLARSPSTSTAGSVVLSMMNSTAPVSIMLTLPLPALSSLVKISSSTSML